MKELSTFGGCVFGIVTVDQTAKETAEIKRAAFAGQERAESGKQINQKLKESLDCVHELYSFSDNYIR